MPYSSSPGLGRGHIVKRAIAIASMLGCMCAQLALGDDGTEALSVPGLFAEVAAQSKQPHAYDWKKASYELQLGFGTVDENNSFENEVWELGLGFPTDVGWIFASGIRRVNMQRTRSSDMLGRSPFVQDAQMTRYEWFFNADWRLVEGRAMSLLSPFITDVEQATFFVVGAHMNHPNRGLKPKKTDKPEPFPGEKRVNSQFNFELGLKWQLYLPKSFGTFFMWTYQRPILGNTGDLKSWHYFTGGLLWSFGAS